jgi:hypothetical protein
MNGFMKNVRYFFLYQEELEFADEPTGNFQNTIS